MKRYLLVSLFLLAACQSGVKVDPSSSGAATSQTPGTRAEAKHGPRSAADPCGSKPFEQLVGTPAEQVKEAMFPAGSRVLRPGMVMTMDYRAERLNVVIGDAGTVERVYCG